MPICINFPNSSTIKKPLNSLPTRQVFTLDKQGTTSVGSVGKLFYEMNLFLIASSLKNPLNQLQFETIFLWSTIVFAITRIQISITVMPKCMKLSILIQFTITMNTG